jgi:hypothetical protein
MLPMELSVRSLTELKPMFISHCISLCFFVLKDKTKTTESHVMITDEFPVFSVYDVMRQCYAEQGRSPTTIQHFCSGAVAGSIVSLISCPIENVRVCSDWLSRQPSVTSTTLTTSYDWITSFSEVFRRGGLMGIFRSLPFVFTRETIGYSVFFGSYYTSKRMLKSAFAPATASPAISGKLKNRNESFLRKRWTSLVHPMIIVISGAVAGLGYSLSEQFVQWIGSSRGSIHSPHVYPWLVVTPPANQPPLPTVPSKYKILSFIRPSSLMRSIPPASIAFLLYETTLKDKL